MKSLFSRLGPVVFFFPQVSIFFLKGFPFVVLFGGDAAVASGFTPFNLSLFQLPLCPLVSRGSAVRSL